MRWPEEQGIGAVPVCSPKLECLRNCLTPAVWPIRIAAVTGSAAVLGQQLGAVCLDEFCQLCLELARLAVQAADLRDLFARDPDPRAGRQLPQRAVDAVQHARLVERAAFHRALELGAQL